MPTRFIKSSDNRTTASTAVLKNGTGGGAPALQELAGYPMSNMMNNDRYSVWASGTPPAGNLYVHIDLGADRSLIAVGYLGLRAAAGGGMPFTITVGKRTAAEGYSTNVAAYGGGGGGVTLATITSSTVDNITEISAATSRYLQFQIAEPSGGGGWLNGFSLGKFIVTTAITNLGIVHSAGAEEVFVTPQIKTDTQSGIPIATRVGLPYFRFTLPFRSVTDAMLGNIQTVASVTDPFVYLRSLGGTFECLPLTDEAPRVLTWAPPNVWDTELAFQQLP